MVGYDGEKLNQLFDTLAQWNYYLENHLEDLPELEP